MYIVPASLGMALEDNGLKEFPSAAYKEAAEMALLDNPNITNRDCLGEQLKIILAVPEEELFVKPVEDWRKLGLLI